MPDASSDSVNVELDGNHLRVDARPARLVSLLRSSGGDPVLTAQRTGGDTHTEAVPAAARQVTFQVQDELSVEATRTSDFVALAEEGGRRVVVAFNGEVTVLPTGPGGDRFALGAHEALLMPAGGGDPKVVPVDDLSDDDQDQISAVMEAAAMAVVSPTAAPDEPTQAMPVVAPESDAPAKPDAPVTEAAPTPPAAPAKSTPTPTKAGAAKGPAGTPAKAGNAQKRSGKKGKKGRPQPQKRPAPLVPGAAGAAGAAAASGVTKKSVSATPVKKSSHTPAKKAAPVKAGGGGGGHDGDSYEDSPGDRRFIAGAVVLALLVVVVLGVFVLTGDDKKSTLAADSSTTTSEEETATTSVTSAPSTPTSAKATTTPTTAATTTSTTAGTTTTAAAPAVKYGIEPKSCVQNANNSITYTAAITNQSTAAFDYTVGVLFKDASGASVAKADAKVDKLEAGKSAEFTATGTPPRDLANTGNCTVERVDARPSGS